MNHFFGRKLISSVVLCSLGLFGALTSAADASQMSSNRNIWHVRHHLEFDIRQLQHDQRDYAEHRVRAIESLQAARNELLAAEEAVHHRQDGGFSGTNLDEPDDRNQWRSNRNMWFVRRDIERQITALQNDEDDYGGHKAAAIDDLQHARMEIRKGEASAERFGY